MKKLRVMLLCLALAQCLASAAYASALTITDSADALEENAQFPFLAGTGRRSVGNRKERQNAATMRVSRKFGDGVPKQVWAAAQERAHI